MLIVPHCRQPVIGIGGRGVSRRPTGELVFKK